MDTRCFICCRTERPVLSRHSDNSRIFSLLFPHQSVLAGQIIIVPPFPWREDDEPTRAYPYQFSRVVTDIIADATTELTAFSVRCSELWCRRSVNGISWAVSLGVEAPACLNRLQIACLTSLEPVIGRLTVQPLDLTLTEGLSEVAAQKLRGELAGSFQPFELQVNRIELFDRPVSEESWVYRSSRSLPAR